ncbi:MAG: cytochrome ubiquinol oxidase subunit I, partial [Melioribacteraceae bacterium]
AFYLLKKKHTDFAVRSFKVGLSIAVFASLFQLITGHSSAVGVSKNQPAKLAAYEAHFDSNKVADMYLIGWVNEDSQKVNFGIAVPKFLSFLIHNDFETPVKGLNAFKKDGIPPVNFVFQTYHLMVAIGFTLIALSLIGLFYLWRGSLFEKKWLLRLFVLSVFLPQAANQLGWFSAEVGRQPWIVYGLLRTSDALSKAVEANQVIFSLILFTIIYALLLVLFIYLLNEKIQHGPMETDLVPSEYEKQKMIFTNNQK